MPTATLTSKGQTTIPQEVRERLKLRAGDQVEFILKDEYAILRPATLDVADLKGFLHKKGMKAASVEQMKEAIRKRGARFV